MISYHVDSRVYKPGGKESDTSLEQNKNSDSLLSPDLCTRQMYLMVTETWRYRNSYFTSNDVVVGSNPTAPPIMGSIAQR
jgi:hypothetical protein